MEKKEKKQQQQKNSLFSMTDHLLWATCKLQALSCGQTPELLQGSSPELPGLKRLSSVTTHRWTLSHSAVMLKFPAVPCLPPCNTALTANTVQGLAALCSPLLERTAQGELRGEQPSKPQASERGRDRTSSTRATCTKLKMTLVMWAFSLSPSVL